MVVAWVLLNDGEGFCSVFSDLSVVQERVRLLRLIAVGEGVVVGRIRRLIRAFSLRDTRLIPARTLFVFVPGRGGWFFGILVDRYANTRARHVTVNALSC